MESYMDFFPYFSTLALEPITVLPLYKDIMDQPEDDSRQVSPTSG